ncbi:MAG TPA: hypothetical protein PLM07_20745 [Candidatus Rifleibacterium sp.]|nr:hypothetical protein [Candidatus Rifleibacterium sp.]
MRLFIFFALLLVSQNLDACTMEPNQWRQVESFSAGDDVGVYALTDALFQFKDKFSREMAACGMATGPVTCISAQYETPPKVIDEEFKNRLQEALEVVWPDARVASQSLHETDPAVLASMATRLPDGYAVQLYFSAIKNRCINLIDENFKLYQLFRLVLREELHLFIRVLDRSGNTVFIDEFSVSPTILVDPMQSPIGGFLIRLEKNSSRQLVVDFGPVFEGGEHVLRLNDAFRQPSPTPPLFDHQTESLEPQQHQH